VLPAVHTVPAVGYAVDTPAGHWVFTGDTCSNPAFWARVNQLRMAMLVIETAFSERELGLALRSQHLSPSLLAESFASSTAAGTRACASASPTPSRWKVA